MPDPAADWIAALLARCTFPPSGTAVSCAVSGGADSSALLILAVYAGSTVTAIHVDHALRDGSAAEARAVERLAQRFGARFVSRCVRVGDGPNLEARARAARYAALPRGVLTGHTVDDQAETVLINLLRGAGADGLAGMRPSPSHPILGLRHVETVELCRALDVEIVDDPSNREPRHLRNRVRAELMPLANTIAGRDVAPILHRQAALLRDESDLLDELAAQLDPTDAIALRSAPLALARRAVRRWLTGEHPPDAAAVERVLQVARGGRIACEVPGVGRIERHQQRLSVVPRPAG